MAVKKKKIGASGRFGAGYGKVKERLTNIERTQRKKQECPFCGKDSVKREAKAIWNCKRCGKKFASGTFIIQKLK